MPSLRVTIWPAWAVYSVEASRNTTDLLIPMIAPDTQKGASRISHLVDGLAIVINQRHRLAALAGIIGGQRAAADGLVHERLADLGRHLCPGCAPFMLNATLRDCAA